MRVKQFTLQGGTATDAFKAELRALSPQLVLCFGDGAALTSAKVAATLASTVPTASVIGCSSTANISTGGVSHDAVIVTAVHFERSQIHVATSAVTDMADSESAGERVAAQLRAAAPHTVLLFGPGVHFNGSALIRGVRRVLGPDVSLIGGLANDGLKFQETLVFSGADVSTNKLVGVGFSGAKLHITHGSVGGWRPFGPVRRVTRAEGNVLYELDGEVALDVYRRYLGDQAAHLPGSALLFPFSMLDSAAQETGVTRTILGLDESNGSITLAGEIVQNGYLRLMCASQDDLINGAEMAAEHAQAAAFAGSDSFALLVSCIGRMSALGQRVEEEIDAVASILGPHCTLAGFYSNGEISSRAAAPEQQLHNQTMTVSRFSEAA